MKRLLLSLTLICTGAAFSQTGTDTGGYSGPAVLSTAGRPLGKYLGQPIDFRFHIGAYGNYYTDLTQPVTDGQGGLTNRDAWGLNGTVGVYGAKHGPRDTLALDFTAGYRAHMQENRQRYNGGDFRGGLDYSRQITARTSVQTRVGATTYGYSYAGLYRPVIDGGLDELAPPAADGFDSRTTNVLGQFGLTHMLSQRWAATASGSGFYINRRSSSLISSRGWNLNGNLRRLLTETSSIGISYGFGHYFYPNGFGESWIHNVAFIFSKQFSERWSFDTGLGAYRVENERLQAIPLDPVLAAIVGQAATLEPFHDTSVGPSIQATLSRAFHRGSVSAYYARGISPGNSFNTTSDRDNAGLSVARTVSNKAEIGGGAEYYRYKAITQGDAISSYYGVRIGLSYKLTRMFHLTVGTSYFVQRVDGGNIDRNRFNVFAGITFSPGERPLSLF